MNRSQHLILFPPASGRRRLAGVTTLLAIVVAGCGSVHGQPAKATGSGHGQTVADVEHQQAAAQRSRGDRVAPRSAAQPRPRAPFIAAGPVIKTFTGDGDRAIGSLAENRTIVIQWKTSAASMQLFTTHGIVLVDASSPAGRVRLVQGHYSGLHVATPGRWTVQLRLAR